MRKGQGPKPKLNNRDLRSLRRHCINNRHSSISDITTWAQDYFGKPLSSTTICSYIHKCQLKLYCAKRKPYVNSVQKRRRLLWARRHLGWTITQWKRVLWSDESVFQVFFGRNGRRVLRTKEEKDHPDCYQQQVQKPGSVMVWGCVSALGKGNLHFCDGTINAEKYIEILATLQIGKCFTVPTFFGMCCRSEWQERMYIYKWHEVDQTKHEIFCSYCLQWNTSQSKFRNHYFLFLFAFSILSQLFLIWGCIKKVRRVHKKHAF